MSATNVAPSIQKHKNTTVTNTNTHSNKRRPNQTDNLQKQKPKSIMSSQNNSQGSRNPRGSSANSTERKKRSRDSVNQILLNLDADCSGIPASVEAARARQIVHPSLLRFPGEASERSQPPTGMTPSGGAGAAGPSRAIRTQHAYPSVAGPSTPGWPQQQRASSSVAGPSNAGWPQQQLASSNVAGPSTAGWPQSASSGGPFTAGRSQQQRASSNFAFPSTRGAEQTESRPEMSGSGTEVQEREPKRRRRDECAKCMRKFNTPVEAAFHQQNCSTKYTCVLCSYSTPYKKFFDRHQARHTDSRCSICNRTFASVEALRVHNQVHSESTTPSFACEQCGKQYNKKNGLLNHIRQKHPHSGQFDCPECFFRFSSLKGLGLHIQKKHRAPKSQQQRASPNIAVPSIGGAEQTESRPETSATETEVQEREPSRRNRYACAKCMRTFNTPAETAFHQQNCSTTYTCVLCSYSTPYKKFFDRHQAKHADSKCSVCNRTFASVEALRAHSQVHSESTTPSFACEHCGKQYNKKTGLQNHIRQKHPHSGQFDCPECFLSFSTQQGLGVHIQKKHRPPKS